MLEDRRLAVLRAIVEDYVSTHEPVGSKALVERHSLGVSPATIRNDMAALEDEGYIAQPHTSAGRVPTDLGYRHFVDRSGAYDNPLLDATGVRDEDHHHSGRAQRDEFDVAHRALGERRVLDERDLPGDLSEEPHGADHDVVEVDCGSEELVDRTPFGRGERLDSCEPVDKVAVAEVGRHSAGARVRLGDVALFLKCGHVIADRRG